MWAWGWVGLSGEASWRAEWWGLMGEVLGKGPQGQDERSQG